MSQFLVDFFSLVYIEETSRSLSLMHAYAHTMHKTQFCKSMNRNYTCFYQKSVVNMGYLRFRATKYLAAEIIRATEPLLENDVSIVSLDERAMTAGRYFEYPEDYVCRMFKRSKHTLGERISKER
ncbi:uncharacterized protein LOC105834575 isoform X1 [Monomorium pharaonis]|uniref:uncharacterized protein LOC105834575 isoform X1 n=1 Tax=Monomorium pharaonis TaxID=307658 RepID=UPI0017478B93|nr:uncharacterized protein LOC105834575 isoform X1 [Monomorium pharaonis]